MGVNLLKTIQHEKLNVELGKMSRKRGKGDLFSVRESYKMLQPRRDIIFPTKGVWVSCAPTKTTFFAWEAAWVRSSHLTSFKEGVGSFPIGAFCMNVIKRWSTVFSCTAMLLGPYGISFSLWLASNGCSPSQLRRCSLAGRGLLRAKKREKVGVQSHYVFFGLFGGKEIVLCLEKGA